MSVREQRMLVWLFVILCSLLFWAGVVRLLCAMWP